MVVPAIQIANALVNDYYISQPFQDQDCGPGIFAIPEKVNVEEVQGKHRESLMRATTKQRVWFTRLVNGADDLWIRYHQYNQISDLERTAAREMNLKREWLSDDPTLTIKCPVCTTLISSTAIVCFACKVILKAEEAKQFKFLGGGPVQALNKV